jgi:cell division transport system ATP-binding protein
VLFATHDRSLLDVRPRRVVILDEGKATDVPQGLVDDGEDELEDDDEAYMDDDDFEDEADLRVA